MLLPQYTLVHERQRAETVKIIPSKGDLNPGVSMQMNFVFAVMDDMMMLGVLKSFIMKLYNSEISAFQAVLLFISTKCFVNVILQRTVFQNLHCYGFIIYKSNREVLFTSASLSPAQLPS